MICFPVRTSVQTSNGEKFKIVHRVQFLSLVTSSRQNMFETIVLNCLNSAKKDLIKSSMDFWATKDAIDELKRLVPVVSGKTEILNS